jgi:DnaJ family protein A protein 2
MVIDTTLYDILGVSPNVNERDLKKAYLKKARECHPDKHRGDPRATATFQEVSDAYEVLKDPQRRQAYDRYGLAGLQESGGIDDMFDIFGSGVFSMFGGGGGSRRPRPPPRTEDLHFECEVTLEDLYVGRNVNLRVKRTVLCTACRGSGCLKGKSPKTCSLCGGRGVRIATQHMGPIITQTQGECPNCRGTGEISDRKDQCKTCRGAKTTEEVKVVVVKVAPGMRNGQQLRFPGQADEAPGAETGDLIVELKTKPHAYFVQKGDDLLAAKRITLSQALLGSKFVIQHLDKRKLLIATGDVIVPDAVKVIANEGMPQQGNRRKKGRLFVRFEVIFPPPQQLTPALMKAFDKSLKPVDEALGIDTEAEDVMPVTMADSTRQEFESAQSTRERRHEAYGADADDAQDYEDNGVRTCQPM